MVSFKCVCLSAGLVFAEFFFSTQRSYKIHLPSHVEKERHDIVRITPVYFPKTCA